MSTLSRYAVTKILSYLAGVLIVVVAIFMVRHFAAFLSDAADGNLPSSVLLRVLGLRTVMALPSLLPAALYIAVLLGLGRMYEDNEITALASCGVPARRIYVSVILFAAGAAVVAGYLSFVARPWAGVTFHRVRDQAIKEVSLGQLAPGRFYEFKGNAERIVFAEARSADDPRVAENVFVQQRDADGISILFAARAIEVVDVAAGYRFLRLFDGYRYDLGTDAAHSATTQYEELTVRTPLDAAPPDSAQEHTLSALALARSTDPEETAELQWRIASPVSAFLLVLLAIPLSCASPGRDRYARLFMAIALYLGYSQLLGLVKKWVANGVWPPVPGTWAVHALCLATALLLLLARRVELGPSRWRPLPRLALPAKSGR